MANGAPNARRAQEMRRRMDPTRAAAVPAHVDLSRAAITDEQAQEVQEMLELQHGLRCGGCGRRITIGFRGISIDPRAEEPIVQRYACARDDCDEAERAGDGAVVIEMVEYAWLDANGKDAPAAKVIVARNTARDEQAAREAGPVSA